MTQNFKEEIKGSSVNANSLSIGSTFSYLDNKHTVTSLKNKIVSVDERGEKRTFTVHEFEGYIYYDFLTIL